MNRRCFLAGSVAAGLVPVPVYAADVRTRVAAIARSATGVVGIYCHSLAKGPPLIAYNADVTFPTASTIKLVILLTAFVLEERQSGALDQTIIARRSRLIGGSEFMANVPDGARLTVRELLVPMIQVSDNTASNALMRHFGISTINAVALRAGMQHTHLEREFLDFRAIALHNDNVSTPRDMALLLMAIERGAREGVRTVASPEHCRAMIRIMLGQTDRDGIPAGLPAGVQVANKTGEIDGTRNDVAIVEPFRDSPYVLAIFSKWVRDYNAIYAVTHKIAALSYAAIGRSGD